MTRIAVAGMHRSGTSMVAALLHRAGLYLGRRKDLMPAGPDNEDGYWENTRFLELNEELLRASGGGWDAPPIELDPHNPDVQAVRVKAEGIGREFDNRWPWAWKDPRNTVTLPFWLSLFPELQIIGCVRNPLEVALSLHRRNDFSYERGLALWLDYNLRLVDNAPPDQLVLTHYDAYFTDPAAELRRVLARCGVEANALKVESACSAVRPGLHHNRFSSADLVSANVAREVIELYARLCADSGWEPQDRTALAVNGSPQPAQRSLNRAVIDTALWRQHHKRANGRAGGSMPGGGKLRKPAADLSGLKPAAEAPTRDPAMNQLQDDLEKTRDQLLAREDQLRQLSSALAAAESRLLDAESRLSEHERRVGLAETTADQLRAEVQELHIALEDRARSELKAQAAVTRSKAANKELRSKIGSLQSQLADLNRRQEEGLTAIADEAVRRLQASMDEAISRLGRTVDRIEVTHETADEIAPEKVQYARLRGRVASALADAIPRGATVLITSKGDDNLLRVPGLRAWHFPRAADGSYTWFYPGDSGSAIAQLEAQRSNGADYLVFPAPSLWWLTHYADFRRHIEHSYRMILNDKETCAVFSLRERPASRDSVQAVVEGVVAELQDHGLSPAILDWTGTSSLANQLSGQVVFSPLESNPPLPYVDKCADIVVIRQPDPTTLREAHRVASSAIITVNGGGVAAVEWIDRVAAVPKRSSIVIVNRDSIASTERCLVALFETIPPSLDVEFLVVDDSSTHESESILERLRNQYARLHVIRNRRPLGIVASRNRGARKSATELIVFLDSDTLPTPGWLEPLLRNLTSPDIGVAGGKLVLADGRLKAAGGVVFSDGSAANFGERELRVDAPPFGHARDVDYCPGALLVTSRSLLLGLGGFDARFESPVQAEADYCFKVWDAGQRVIFQPDSLVVHYGSDSLTEVDAKAQTMFGRRWERVLRTRPRRPARLDGQAWHFLAVREPWEAPTT